MNDAKNIFKLYTESKQEPELHVDGDGTKRWMVDGKYHREDGPAIEWPWGSKEWYLNGKLHREDGPATEWAGGIKAWWLNGRRYDGIAAWAKALLKYKKIKPTQQAIDAKVAEMMQVDLFN